MGKSILDAVREICLAYPEVEEVVSHGSPNFKVRGKVFATYSLNHHGDGRVALWLQAPRGGQDLYTEMEPDYYFVPPYVGPKGWLGVELNKGLSWDSIAQRVHEAYKMSARRELSESMKAARNVEPPDIEMTAEQINPFLRKRAQDVLDQLKEVCQSLPETLLVSQFGNPAWKAGKKTFVSANYYGDRLSLQFRVGLDKQAMLTMDSRYSIPAYTGNNGWIDLDVEEHADWAEINELLLDSYRHFALKRMLMQLG